MNSLHKLILLLAATFSLALSPAWAATPEPPAVPPNYVVDLAGIIRNDAERRLNAYLRELERKTTVQMFVLTVQSLDGESIDGFSLRMAEKWKPGQKEKDNGALMTVALKDRKYRFEIGYGLEGVLPDSLVGSIGRRYLVPYFKKGDYSMGIYATSLAVINEIAQHEGVKIEGLAPVKSARRVKKEVGLLEGIIGVVFLVLAIVLFIRHPWLFMLLLFSSGTRGGWHGGGGFGGGGGGGFGGGGASGGW